MINNTTVENLIDNHVLLNATPMITELIQEETSTGQDIHDSILVYEQNNNLDDVQIYEWWIISKQLSKHLDANNEFIYNYCIMYDIWGRQSENSHIKYDTVFESICI